jgi:hypothetical protein
MAENYPDIDCPTNIVDTYQNVNSDITTLAGRDCQSSSPSEISSVIINSELINRATFGQITKVPRCFSRLCWCITYYRWYASHLDPTLSVTELYLERGITSHDAVTFNASRNHYTALRDTEPRGAACSPRTLAISQSTVGKHPTRTTTHGMSVSRAPTVGFPSYDPASPSSETERRTIIEDDVVNNTIPVVRGVVCNHAFTLIYILRTIPACCSCKESRHISPAAARQHCYECSSDYREHSWTSLLTHLLNHTERSNAARCKRQYLLRCRQRSTLPYPSHCLSSLHELKHDSSPQACGTRVGASCKEVIYT